MLLEVEALRQSIAHGDENWEADVVAAFHRPQPADEAFASADPEAIQTGNCATGLSRSTDQRLSSRWIKQFAMILYNQAERYRDSCWRTSTPKVLS